MISMATKMAIKLNRFNSSRSFMGLFSCGLIPVKKLSAAYPRTSCFCCAVRKETRLTRKLSELWREVQGSRNWQDLVEPLHPLLRNEVVRYGEFVNACYKAFDMDSSSKQYLTCKYRKHSMLQEVGLETSGYKTTKYIYTAPDININIPLQKDSDFDTRWIGYVAVSSDEETLRKLGRRDIVIAFRGTVTQFEWMANMMTSLTTAKLDSSNPRENVKVESGFLSLYSSCETNSLFGLPSCRKQLLSEVSRLMRKYKGEELSISIAGHSMGSSLAVLHAYDIAELGLNRAPDGKEVPVTVYSFGGPRVGNLSFKERCQQLGIKVLRIVNAKDPVTKVPGLFLNENNSQVLGKNEIKNSCYAHVGVELVLDFYNMGNPSCVHDLDTYISLLKYPKPSQRFHCSNVETTCIRKHISAFQKPLKHAIKDVTSFLQSRNTDYFLHSYLYKCIDF